MKRNYERQVEKANGENYAFPKESVLPRQPIDLVVTGNMKIVEMLELLNEGQPCHKCGICRKYAGFFLAHIKEEEARRQKV